MEPSDVLLFMKLIQVGRRYTIVGEKLLWIVCSEGESNLYNRQIFKI
jgi:hypothetical protein